MGSRCQRKKKGGTGAKPRSGLPPNERGGEKGMACEFGEKRVHDTKKISRRIWTGISGARKKGRKAEGGKQKAEEDGEEGCEGEPV